MALLCRKWSDRKITWLICLELAYAATYRVCHVFYKRKGNELSDERKQMKQYKNMIIQISCWYKQCKTFSVLLIINLSNQFLMDKINSCTTFSYWISHFTQNIMEIKQVAKGNSDWLQSHMLSGTLWSTDALLVHMYQVYTCMICIHWRNALQYCVSPNGYFVILSWSEIASTCLSEYMHKGHTRFKVFLKQYPS